jgi:hypothetical protein
MTKPQEQWWVNHSWVGSIALNHFGRKTDLQNLNRLRLQEGVISLKVIFQTRKFAKCVGKKKLRDMQVSDKQLLAKMRLPVHINFIAHMLRSDKEEAMERIKSLISQGLVVESTYAKDYFVVKNTN